jgi:thiol-disulfide isomerase/thioredoxin
VSGRTHLCFALVSSALAVVLVAGCGGETVYQNVRLGQAAPVATQGWAKVDPIAVVLPTDVPITPGAKVLDNSVPILVNIWASWCGPCKTELPLLQQVASTGALRVIGFSRDRDTANAEDALKAAGVTYPNWLDSDASLGVELDRRVPLSSVPSSVVIRDGKVIAVHIGEFKDRAEILQALEQK